MNTKNRRNNPRSSEHFSLQNTYIINSEQINNIINKHILDEDMRNFNNKIIQLKEKNILSVEQIQNINEIISKNPLYKYFIIPIILDYKNTSIDKIIQILDNCLENENFFGKKFHTQELNFNNISNFFEAYYINNFSEEELSNLYENNLEKFLTLYHGYVYKGEKSPSYLEEILGFPTDYDFVNKKYRLIPEEQEMYGYIYRFGKYHYLKEKNAIFHRIIFYNFIKKLPKFSGKVYRGINLANQESYKKFLQNPTESLNSNIQNFSTNKNISESFAKKKFGVIIEIETNEIHELKGILYDTESHAWFENGTQFEVIEIKEGEPTQIKMKAIFQ